MTGADVVTAARCWMGVKYRHQGRSREGVDCIGLPVCVRADLGLDALDAEPGYTTSEGFEMLAYCKANMVEIDRADIRPGDILVQMYGAVRHMAIVADYVHGGLSIVHAWISNRRVCECRLDESFLQAVRGCFRFKEIA